jgi:hypothetical protein
MVAGTRSEPDGRGPHRPCSPPFDDRAGIRGSHSRNLHPARVTLTGIDYRLCRSKGSFCAVEAGLDELFVFAEARRRYGPPQLQKIQVHLRKPLRLSQGIRRSSALSVNHSDLVGSRRDGFEELNWVAPYDRLLPLGERPTQFGQGDILQLPDPLSGHSEFLSKFFERFRFAAVQPESFEDNLALAVVQHLQKLAKFVAHVLVSEQLERRLRIFITDDLAKFG